MTPPTQPQVFTLAQAPVTTHAFNADLTRLAASINSNEFNVYEKKGGEWAVNRTLSEHDKLITSIDWAPRSNRIVTASQDRNAYVWEETQTGEWKPTLVVLRLTRAATHVRWSPNEDKFAVASGAKAIAVCSFDEENVWWVSKLLRKPIRSTVLSVDWHPNNVLLAAGSADARARVFSAYVKEVDAKPAPTIWGSKLPFNTVCGEFASPAGGWVHAVAFSPSGDTLAFASHDSSVSVVYGGASGGVVHTIRMPSLPLVSIIWTDENTVVGAGHDCKPLVFSGDEQNGWSEAGSLDESRGTSSVISAPGRLKAGAFFRDTDSRGTTGQDTRLATVHQNTITEIRMTAGRISTSGVDGQLVMWS